MFLRHLFFCVGSLSKLRRRLKKTRIKNCEAKCKPYVDLVVPRLRHQHSANMCNTFECSSRHTCQAVQWRYSTVCGSLKVSVSGPTKNVSWHFEVKKKQVVMSNQCCLTQVSRSSTHCLDYHLLLPKDYCHWGCRPSDIPEGWWKSRRAAAPVILAGPLVQESIDMNLKMAM